MMLTVGNLSFEVDLPNMHVKAELLLSKDGHCNRDDRLLVT